jgi:hypothetical protein
MDVERCASEEVAGARQAMLGPLEESLPREVAA